MNVKRFRALAALFMSGIMSTGCASSHFLDGYIATTRRDYGESVQNFEKVAAKLEVGHPNYNIVKLYLAIAYWNSGEYKSAQSAFKDVALQIWGDDLNWLTDFTNMTGGIKNESKREWFGQENEQIFIRIFTGLTYMLDKHYDEAIVEFQRVSEKNENYPIAEYFWGLAARELEDENSVVHFEKAGRLTENKNPYITLNKAYLAAFDGNIDEAAANYGEFADKAGANRGISSLEDLAARGTNVCVLINWGMKQLGMKLLSRRKNPELRIEIDGKDYGRAFYIDKSDNRESLKSRLAKGSASLVGQEARERLTGSIPGVSLFVGGKRNEFMKNCMVLPERFYVFETFLPQGDHEVVVHVLDKDGNVKYSTKSTKAKVFGDDLTILPVVL